jgi:hypothetical protein
MRVGFTGTRVGMTDNQKKQLTGLLQGVTEFHHGDCVGADAQAHDIARNLGCSVVIHPPVLRTYRAFKQSDRTRVPKSYVERNHDIVDEVELLIAAPSGPEAVRSGTWSTVRYARKLGRKVEILGR